uniref:Uncharacterized protein n=1 Tax=Clytia hemisphaerica TaxID=252671 RepID=A0A7M5V8K1_9CNID
MVLCQITCMDFYWVLQSVCCLCGLILQNTRNFTRNAKCTLIIISVTYYVYDVDKRLENMRPLDVISRRPRPLSGNIGHLKANELRSWLLYYSLPCMECILPEIYWNHFALLVEATHILLADKISKDDLSWAESCLDLFYKYFEELYAKTKCGLNVHNCSHLCQSVRNWGPLWAWSCFGFESLNGRIIKQVHGTRNACSQVFKAFSGLKTIHSMMSDGRTKEIVKEGLTSMIINKQSGGMNNWKVVNDAISLGGKSDTFIASEELKGQVQLYNISDSAEKYYKIRKNKVTYSSVEYKHATKTINYVAELSINESKLFVEIQYFLCDQGRVYLCGKEIPRKENWCMLKEWHRSKLIRVDREISTIHFIAPVEFLCDKLFYIDGNRSCVCISKVPNIVEGD